MVKVFLAPCRTKVHIQTSFAQKDQVKRILGRVWNPSRRMWEVAIENLPEVYKVFPGAMAHPDVTAHFETLQQKRNQILAVKDMDDAPRNVPGLRGTLYPYQAVGRAFLQQLEPGQGAILGFDMGLGKTITALAEFVRLHGEGKAKRCLVVCPASLKYATWAKEIAKWTNLSYQIIDGRASEPVYVEQDVPCTELVRDEHGNKVRNRIPQYFAKETETFYDLPLMSDIEDRFGPLGRDDIWSVKEQKQSWVVTVQRYAGCREGGFLRRETGEYRTSRTRLTGSDLRKHQYKANATILVTNYESFLHDCDMIPTLNHDWVLICDEVHRLKNPGNKTTKNLLKKCDGALYKYLLTGTPLENSISELWSLVNFSRKGLLGTFYKFKDRYMITDYFGNEIGPNPKTMSELRERIAPIMLRRKKGDVLKDLPPLTEQEYWVEMTHDQAYYYQKIKAGIVEMGNGDFSYLDILAQITRMQQVLDSPALLRNYLQDDTLPEDSAKLTELERILEDVGENKAIIFSQYREMADIIYRRMVDRFGPKAVRYISGQTNIEKRGIYQQDFQEDPDVRFMVITTAGNYGLDLYKASYVICYDQLFNPQKMAQILARAHRNGAEQPITAIHLLTRDSYEERKLRILAKKRELFTTMIDNDDLNTLAKLDMDDLRYLVGA